MNRTRISHSMKFIKIHHRTIRKKLTRIFPQTSLTTLLAIEKFVTISFRNLTNLNLFLTLTPNTRCRSFRHRRRIKFFKVFLIFRINLRLFLRNSLCFRSLSHPIISRIKRRSAPQCFYSYHFSIRLSTFNIVSFSQLSFLSSFYNSKIPNSSRISLSSFYILSI